MNETGRLRALAKAACAKYEELLKDPVWRMKAVEEGTEEFKERDQLVQTMARGRGVR